MPATPSADELRAMAEHRGYKLLRSRKRTPGVGDFGKFGLADANGKSLIGVGQDGLTASAAEIADFLRSGAASSWKRSAETMPPRPPARPPAKANRHRADPEADADPPVRRKAAVRKAPRGLSSGAIHRQQPPPRAKPVLRIVKAEPKPEPDLVIRAASARDAAGIERLLGELAMRSEPRTMKARLASLKRPNAGLFVAEREELVGCCAWAVIPTLQHGPLGRVTLLLVGKAQRRRGIATAMLAAAEHTLAKSGCALIEVMSDIEIDNAHGFFRSSGFEQKSHRFVRFIHSG